MPIKMFTSHLNHNLSLFLVQKKKKDLKRFPCLIDNNAKLVRPCSHWIIIRHKSFPFQ